MFEELDRRLMERVGVHLADVGDLSSPALTKILKDTECPSEGSTPSSAFHADRHRRLQYPAPSPAAASAAAAAGLSFADETSTIGIDLSRSATPGASLASILNGGPIEPSSCAQVTGTTATGRGRGSGVGGGAAAARAAAAAREAGLPPPRFLSVQPGSPSLSDHVEGCPDSPAASRISSGASPASSGISSVTPNKYMSSPKGFRFTGGGGGGGDGGGRNGGRLSHSNSLAASPLSMQPYPHSGGGGRGGGRGQQAERSGRPSAVGIPAVAAGDGLGGGGKNIINRTASVEVAAGRDWIPSPIDAKNVGREDGAFSTPWDRRSSSSGSAAENGHGNGTGDDGSSASSYRPGDGLGLAGSDGGAGDGSGAWEGRRKPGPEPPREQQQAEDFDEQGFAQQEQRMRHAYLQRLASEEEASGTATAAAAGSPSRG